MAQANAFRTKRRRQNGRRNAENAENRRTFSTFVKLKRAAHEGLNSFAKRFVEHTK